MKLYSWRAFTASQQLADAGVAWADSAVDAEKIARMCLGGPLMNRVTSIDVAAVLTPNKPYVQVQVTEVVN